MIDDFQITNLELQIL